MQVSYLSASLLASEGVIASLSRASMHNSSGTLVTHLNLTLNDCIQSANPGLNAQ